LAGDIVWCNFPNSIQPKPKPRPALVLSTIEDKDGQLFVCVAYGTSQKTNRLFRGEFLIANSQNPISYRSAGLSYDTKFDLNNHIELPYNDDYFSVPPMAPFGQNPKLGILHPSMVKVAAAAFQSIQVK
jgi:hypothetical protein